MIWDNFTKGWKNIFNFSGHATRAEYWAFTILSWIFMVLLTIAIMLPISLAVDETKETMGKFGILIFFIITPYLIATLSLMVRRIRDTGVSGWWSLLFLPVNAIFYGIPALILGFIPSAQVAVTQASVTYQQKASPEIKDFHYTPEPKTQSNQGTAQPSRSAAARLPLKDFN